MENIIKDITAKSQQLIGTLREELGGIRANRPSAQLVEEIVVDYAGQKLKVKQLGSISVNPPREIVVSVWDKEAISAVAKAIQDSPVKLNPSIEGAMIRLSLPSLTAERREELTKLAKQIGEKIRIRLRAFRDEANKQIEGAFKIKTISEDQKFKSKKKVQDVVDEVNKEIEAAMEKKIKEIVE